MLFKIITRLSQLKIYNILLGILIVILISTIRYIFSIHSSDIIENIFIGISCVITRILLVDYIENFFITHDINLNIGQILWGRQFTLGGQEDINLSNKILNPVKVDEIKILFMADNNSTNNSTTQYNTVPPPLTINGEARTFHREVRGNNNAPYFYQVNRTCRLSSGQNFTIPEHGYWALPDTGIYNNNFNQAFSVYRQLPKAQIMHDYDLLINGLSRPHAETRVVEAQYFALKFAGSHGIFPEEVRAKMKGFGNGDEINRGNSLPRSIVTKGTVRIQIHAALVENRAHIIEALDNRYS